MTQYIFAYAILSLFVGLSVYIVCRPSRRFDGDR